MGGQRSVSAAWQYSRCAATLRRSPLSERNRMPPVALPDMDEDILDLDIELLMESDSVIPIQSCSGSNETCGTQVSWSGTCAVTQECTGTCSPTYGAMAPGMCVCSMPYGEPPPVRSQPMGRPAWLAGEHATARRRKDTGRHGRITSDAHRFKRHCTGSSPGPGGTGPALGSGR